MSLHGPVIYVLLQPSRVHRKTLVKQNRHFLPSCWTFGLGAVVKESQQPRGFTRVNETDYSGEQYSARSHMTTRKAGTIDPVETPRFKVSLERRPAISLFTSEQPEAKVSLKSRPAINLDMSQKPYAKVSLKPRAAFNLAATKLVRVDTEGITDKADSVEIEETAHEKLALIESTQADDAKLREQVEKLEDAVTIQAQVNASNVAEFSALKARIATLEATDAAQAATNTAQAATNTAQAATNAAQAATNAAQAATHAAQPAMNATYAARLQALEELLL